jgi:hypothetical protein
VITSAAQINDAVISNAKIQNAAITTAKIGANQVTFPQFAAGDTVVDFPIPSLEQNVVQLTVNQSGAPAYILAEAIITHFDGNFISADKFAAFTFNLKRNGSIISGVTNAAVGGLNTPSFIIDTLSTFEGSVTYSLHVTATAGNDSFLRVLQSSIFFIELKK